ncbi:uncharacterized protein APUU_30988A [Aspergillus puulaauensis]|uniref:GPI anchored protein n=1 Tax=Aspergillus puulaauensis TaxID=1220207 RepID=A0A7R8AML1_9EURO|nr:uncharacterized protein APUU_30988A [Aspergillus puulaauensis]BCS22763.1 hypothetical protein APUU_30988A [Aspergillus puulaauensis]
MAYKLSVLLLVCLLVITSYANVKFAHFDAVLDEDDSEGHLNYYDVDKARAMDDHGYFARAEPATVTVTKTVCGPGASEAPGDSPIISLPETTLVTDTPAPSPAPTFDQPPASSGTDSAPPSVKPTSTEAPTSPPEGHTTALQTSLPSSADESEAPTATSATPSSTTTPIVNAGYTEGGMSTLVLALTLTFIRLLGF